MTTRHFEQAYREALRTCGTRYAKLGEGARDLTLAIQEFRTLIDKGNLRTLTKVLNVIQMELIRRGLADKATETSFTTRLFRGLDIDDASGGTTNET